MNIYDILNVYITKETNEIYHWERLPFELVDREKQELYMGNFKTADRRTGSKLFELRFQEARRNRRRSCFTKLCRVIRKNGRT